VSNIESISEGDENEGTKCSEGIATMRARILLGAYTRDIPKDPALFNGQLIAVLCDYPEMAVINVTDIRNPNSLQRTKRWLPALSEVCDALEAATARLFPPVDMGGDFKAVPRANLRKGVMRFYEKGIWPFPSPKPGQPDCRVPADMLPAALLALTPPEYRN
jgi:hypothetical protein